MIMPFYLQVDIVPAPLYQKNYPVIFRREIVILSFDGFK